MVATGYKMLQSCEPLNSLKFCALLLYILSSELTGIYSFTFLFSHKVIHLEVLELDLWPWAQKSMGTCRVCAPLVHSSVAVGFREPGEICEF